MSLKIAQIQFFLQGELAEEVSPGRNAAGSTNILVGTGLNDFGEKIAQIFGQSGANVFDGWEACEYKNKHARTLVFENVADANVCER